MYFVYSVNIHSINVYLLKLLHDSNTKKRPVPLVAVLRTPEGWVRESNSEAVASKRWGCPEQGIS